MPQQESNTSTTLRNTETALECLRRGYQPVPLVSGQKKAKIAGWSKLHWENDDAGLEDARQKFDAWADTGHGGIGVLLGSASGDLIDIDLDHPLTLRLKDHFLPPTPARSGRDSRPSTHYWYHAAPGTLQETRTFKLPNVEEPDRRMIVEYRSTGGQTAIPGNVHPSGELYRWAGAPWGGDAGPAVVDGRVLLVQVALLGFCTLLTRYWPKEGGRHEAYLALAGGLLRVGDGVHPYWERNIGVVIAAIADATNDDDGAETRIAEAVETTRARLREGKPAAGFTKLGEHLGEEVVKQARVLLAEVESAAGLPARTSSEFTLERLGAAVGGVATPETRTGPATPDELRARQQQADETSDPAPQEPITRPQVEDDDSNLPSIARDPLEERVGTWEALDLEPYLTGQVQTVSPTVLEREDGQALFYPGRLNMLYGPSESAKSWVAMFTCLQLLERGERVLYLDFEDEPVNALQRMRLLGASYDDLRNAFRYVRPEEPLAPMQRNRWGAEQATDRGRLNQSLFQKLLDEHDPALIVADGMTVLYGLHGLDSNDSVQTDTITSWLKTLTRNGRSTVIIVDHTAKNPQRGSLPIGSQHKVSMVQGTLLQAYPVRQPMPGAVGEIDLIVLKDRPGQVRAASEKSGEKAQLAAKVTMDSTTPGTTRVTLGVPPRSGAAGPPTTTVADVDLSKQRAAEMQEQADAEDAAVLRAYGNQVGSALSKSQLIERVYHVPNTMAASTLQKNAVARGLKRLIKAGWISQVGSTKDTVYILAVSVNDDDDA